MLLLQVRAREGPTWQHRLTKRSRAAGPSLKPVTLVGVLMPFCTLSVIVLQQSAANYWISRTYSPLSALTFGLDRKTGLGDVLRNVL